MNQHEIIIESAMKFSSAMATSYAEEVGIKQDKIASEKANKLIKYIESKYEQKIKKEIKKNKDSSYVDIKLPLFSKIKNANVFDKVVKLVEGHFRNLGFRAVMSRGICGDDECILFDICNSRDKIRLYW